MARRPFGFRPSLRQQKTGVALLMQHMALSAPPEKREAAKAFADESLAAIPPKRERAAPRQLEAPVIQAVSQLLAVHPRVLWAARFNSGAAGEHAQVKFHWFVRKPEKIRMPDFFGATIERHTCGIWSKAIAVECKAPGWTHPRDDREREQAAFLKMIRDAGGIGIFATSAQDVADALK